MMKNKGYRFGGRRQKNDMPIVPFKDSSGSTIWGCRRKNPDRRINNTQSEWIDTEWVGAAWVD